MIARMLFLGGRHDRELSFFRRPQRLFTLLGSALLPAAVAVAISLSASHEESAATADGVSAPVGVPVADHGAAAEGVTAAQLQLDRRLRSAERPSAELSAAPSSQTMPLHESGTVSGGQRAEMSADARRNSFPPGAMSAELPAIVMEEHRYAPVKVIAPAETLPEADVDMLFVHAHPDDESLDFGLLMSKAARSGKRIATVLFTDGESGHDRYPHRPVYGSYADRPLTGAQLAERRIDEATRALSILGSRYYIRLGRTNHPYASIAEELPLKEVLKRWGGLERNVAKLLEIIRSLHPEIVVSPAGPSDVSEHFEHEAAAHIVRQALLRLEEAGSHSVRGYLVAVNPQHRPLYQSLVAVPAGPAGVREARAGGTVLRELQLAALRQHVTQLDASVLGVATRSARAKETYAPLAWRFDRSLFSWLQNGLIAGE